MFYFPTGISQENIADMPYLKYCVLETIRLRSPGVITRAVVKPMKIRVGA